MHVLVLDDLLDEGATVEEVSAFLQRIYCLATIVQDLQFHILFKN